ncbi:hypothetical protein ADJ73_08570 [Arsenicicoccus sp. oral taxon 190]|nr:hypothetical protein ADJ73_08570 [Arsenicicoccus sp. oral taxon 190]
MDRRAHRAFLPEIQALRMWAVGLVVLFHLWPTGVFRGGFVGVDAFFVISGYLITSHLIREVESTGRIRLGAFYARRARRLLPASLLVLLVSAVLTLVFLPQDTWSGAAAEIVASTGYVQNLWLASKAVTYSASNEAASAVQHYWSLSTEEQFYLVWPSLILLALAVARRRRPSRPVVAIGAVLTVTALASFVFSVAFTASDQAAAYFVTPTRAWEFAAGAILPLVLRRYAPPGPFAVVLRYVGLGMLLLSALLLSQQTPFPGWVALWPVVGTAMIILAGDCEGHDRADRLFSNRVAQWLGDISYSVYLWHWPLIVVLPYVVGGSVQLWHQLAIVALTLVLSHLSKVYVEDATRYVPQVRASTRRTLQATAAAMGVLVLVGAMVLGASAIADWRRDATIAEAAGGPCAGGRAGLHLDRCPDAFTRAPLVSTGPGDVPWKTVDGCTTQHDPYLECGWGARSRTVAIVGDSHAEHYRAAIHDVARRKGWRVIVMIKQACPAVDASLPMFGKKRRDDPDECRTWLRRSTPLLKQQGVDLILTSGFASASPVPGKDSDAAYHRVWDEWTSFADVVALRDVPRTGEQNMPQCLAQHSGDQQACAHPRAEALPTDQLTQAARSTTNPKVRFVDLSDAYCDQRTCYAVAGGIPVYMDQDHVAYSFMQTLAPVIEAKLPS